uniref:Uncharacterized protein n=1 Tax=Arundo donax TaxID=35708 RepID=A0A0A9BFR3_ARUDO
MSLTYFTELLIWRSDPLGKSLMPVPCPGSLVQKQQQPDVVAALANRVLDTG